MRCSTVPSTVPRPQQRSGAKAAETPLFGLAIAESASRSSLSRAAMRQSRLGGDVRSGAVRLLETSRRRPRRRVDDVVGVVRSDTRRNAAEPGSSAHPVGDSMIGARTVAADPEPADNLAPGIERNAAAKGDNPARYLADRRNAGIVEDRVERVRIVQPNSDPPGWLGA